MNNKGVNYVRLHHGTVKLERNKSDIENIGAYYVHKTDKEVKLIIISTGFMAENAVLAAKELEIKYNIPTNVINLVAPKKFDEYASNLILNNAPIITLYNGNPKILSQCVSECIMSTPYIPKPKFIAGHGFISGTSGSVEDLIKYYGFDKDGIEQFVLKKIKKFH